MTEKKVEMLEVVDESGKVVGLEERGVVHQQGLLHKEVHVIFVTPQKEIIFQHREKDKASWPDALDATAGGHVDPGEDALSAAVREAVEETGLNISSADLVNVGIVRSNIFEPHTGVTNNVLRTCYGYLYKDKLEDLKIEQGKIIAFEKYKLEDLKNLTEREKKKFIPERLEKFYMDMYVKIFTELKII
jgi:8-oxo-dGTP pyrophosphatase MutT (NUDIX family)